MRWRTTLGVVVMMLCGSAAAYLAGGHYYTLWALHAIAQQKQLIKGSDDYWSLEALCAEIPDVSREFDAITQRQRVLWSLDMREVGTWGWMGACYSPISKHMAASQYYIHGLTGAPKSSVRRAAADLIARLAPQDRADLSDQDKANWACARGFALHLYGDSFAHSEFGEGADGLLYPTGMGHLREYSQPDYMAASQHDPGDRWTDWTLGLSQALYGSPDAGIALNALVAKEAPGLVPQGKNEDPKVAESTGVENLLKTVGPPPYPGIVLDIANVEKDVVHMVDTDCQGELNKAAGNGVSAPGRLKPDCAKVWAIYLSQAREAFRAQGVTMRGHGGPQPDCDDPGDVLQWGSQ
ncbi:MAG: hypothetical protein ABSF50_03110 [Burkholderiaceae bacterium]|jgi:hypothetical protein